jgi:nitrilase
VQGQVLEDAVLPWALGSDARCRCAWSSLARGGYARTVGDVEPRVRVAAVQAASVFLDRDASTEKACELIRRAGARGAELVAFPEGFIPAHPLWFHFHAATSKIVNDLSVELFENAVEIPGPQVTLLQQAARDAGTYVVIGMSEKRAQTFGTLYNTLLFLGPEGQVLSRHQKLVPTVGERLVHAPGEPRGLVPVRTRFGAMSGLICGENSNPLAVSALTMQYTRVHVMSWPSHFPTSGAPLRQRVLIDSQAFAQMTKAFVVSACGTVDEHAIERLQVSDEQEALLRSDDFCGGSLVVAPDSSLIAGPLGSEEDILCADIDLAIGVRMKLRHDFAGHYNRPDVFQLRVNLGASHLLDLSRSTIGPPILEAEALGAPEGSDSLVWSRAVSAVTERSETAAFVIDPEDPGSAAEPGVPAS